MGSLEGGGVEGPGQETFQEFPVDEDPAKEPLGRSDRWHHVEVGVHYLLLDALCLATVMCSLNGPRRRDNQ